VDLDAVLAALVAHHHHGGAVADPGGQPIPDPVGTAVLADGLLPQRHREELPPRLEGDGVPGGVEGEVPQVPVGGHELAGPLHPRAVEVDPDPVAFVGGGVVEPDLGGVLVDDPGAVGLGETGVVLVVVGVAAEVVAVGRGRVEVADPLVVGQEPDPVPDPHRRGRVAGQAEEPAEVAVAPPVDPQIAGRAAPVALPPGGVGGVAPQDDGRLPVPAVPAAAAGAAGAAEGDLPGRAVGQSLDGAALGGHGVGVDHVMEGLPGLGREQDPPVGRPAPDGGAGAQERDPGRRTAGGRHAVHLGMVLLAAGEGDVPAVGRQRRVTDLRQVGREPPGDPAPRRDRPQVVFGDKGDGVAPETGMP
jgi:hypothetical protein